MLVAIRVIYWWLVPAKFVYIVVCKLNFLAVKYKHKLRGESSSAWEKNSTQCLTLAVQWDVKIEEIKITQKSFYRFLSDKTKEKKECQKKWIAAVKHEKWPESDSQIDNARLCSARILFPVGTNGKPLAAVGKFSTAIGKLMIGKTLATNQWGGNYQWYDW